MKCPYSDQPDIYEEYLLHRLPAAARARFEQHQEICPSCRKELQKQRLIIAGLREIGKQEMKAEIRQQVQQLETASGRDWGIYLKIAAAVLFLVIAPGMIYYYQQMSPPLPAPAIDEMGEQQKSALPTAQPPEMMTSQTGAAEKEQLAVTAESEEKYRRQKAAEKSEPSQKAKREMAEADGRTGRQEMITGSVPPVSPGMTADRLDLRMNEEGAPPAPSDAEVKPAEMTASGGTVTVFLFDTSRSQSGQGETLTGGILSEIAVKKQATVASNEWQFSSHRQQVMVQFDEPVKGAILDEKSRFPAEFPVQILHRDSSQITMLWQVGRQLREIDPATIQLLLEDEAILKIDIAPQIQYRIDLSNPSTSARRVH